MNAEQENYTCLAPTYGVDLECPLAALIFGLGVNLLRTGECLLGNERAFLWAKNHVNIGVI